MLDTLPKSWQLKSLAIEESKDLKTLPLEELVSSLLTYEMKMKRIEELDNRSKSKKGAIIKVIKKDSGDNCSTNDEDDEFHDEEMAMIMRKFKEYLEEEISSQGVEAKERLQRSLSLKNYF